MLEDLIKLIKKTAPFYFSGIGGRKQYNLDDQRSARWVNRSREAVLLATSVYPDKSSILKVADFGCGDMKIKSLLLQQGYRGISYSGYDFLPQTDEVVEIDFNKKGISGRYDVIFCMGLLEYINDISAFLAQIRGITDYVILSYVASDLGKYSDKDIESRGWTNHLSSASVESLIADTGFDLQKKKILDGGVTMLYLIKS